ncbi:carboxylate-amine ligase [Agromyces larvae]|uniref:Glutamate-cysteine ligase family protein n=1 Tax=Agromyces larvae TaxID=2929802 RepID=A0ABY4BVT8_9MICO|nr:glutamate-cysteine ligase family protein [Agromyces larvae]UOE43293.1 glutamate-cysteine ligase family protein [Agromyces larvae]
MTDAAAPDATGFGIEEEFVLLDPETLRPAPVGPEVLARLRAAGFETATSEFLASQVEFASPVFRDGAEATAELARFRSVLAGIADGFGVVAASTGTPFDSGDDPEVFPEARYARVHDDIGAMIADHQVCGLHVHVGIADRADRVRVLNGLRAWTPMLTALAANAPFHRGADSGFASWRTVVLRRWTTHGIPARFADEADYDRRLAELAAGGAPALRALFAGPPPRSA